MTKIMESYFDETVEITKKFEEVIRIEKMYESMKIDIPDWIDELYKDYLYRWNERLETIEKEGLITEYIEYATKMGL